MADYVVSTWDEFLQYNFAPNNIKFANPHEINGEIVLSGTGTHADPYIVSTYEEMLFATGATYIWQVKLIDREQKIYRYRYISDYDEQRNPIYSEIFCKYDDSLSTIDFNDIQPEGFTDRLYFTADRIDFNGWTLINIIIKYDMVFRSEVTNAYKNGRFINLIIQNTQTAIAINSPSYVKACIFDILVENTSSTNIFDELPSNSVITIRAAQSTWFSISGSSYHWVKNTVVNLNIPSDLSASWSFGLWSPDTCLVRGVGETANTSNISIADYSRYTIFNFETSKRWAKPNVLNGVTLINSTKAPNITSDETLFKLVTDEIMRSAQDLADLGLPIGVD